MVKYLLAHQLDHSWGICTRSVGLQVIPPGAHFPYGEHPQKYLWERKDGRVLDEMDVLYLYQGGGWFMSAHCPRTHVQAGDVIFLFPNEWHNYAPDDDTGWEEVWVGFTGDYALRIFREPFFSVSHPIVRIGIRPTLYSVFEKAFMIAYDERPAYQQQLAGCVLQILGSIYAYSKQVSYGDSPDTARISAAQKFMREHAAAHIRMEDVAAHVGMGYSKFRKLFRSYTGFSPRQFFLNLKLEQSKDLLLNTRLSSKEIAFRLGYDTATYFNRIFRLHFHQSPIEYRNSVNKVSRS